MHKVGIVITSALEGSGNSAIYRALMFAQELQRAGDDVVVLFDGSGSTAAAALLDPSHRMHALLQSVRGSVRGVCRYCASSYGVLEAVRQGGLELLGDDRGHASLRRLLDEGRQIVTF
jgi:sulfur relay (sulfurtransferase) complex TusBCD TusD component (DsrE family)